MELFKSLPDFEAYFRRFVHVLQSDGVRIVLVTEGSLYRADLKPEARRRLRFSETMCASPRGFFRYWVPSVASMAAAMDRFNDVIRLVASEERLDLIDLAAVTPKTTEFFFDDVHHTERGALFAAEVVGKALAAVATAAR